MRSAERDERVEELLDRIDSVMHRVGRLMSARQSAFQRASGMTTPHFMVLKMISCEGPVRISELAALLGVTSPAISMLVQQLEADGLIERRHDATDNRAVLVSLTEAGRERLARAEVFRRDLLRTMTRDLSVEDLEAFARILSTITETVSRRT